MSKEAEKTVKITIEEYPIFSCPDEENNELMVRGDIVEVPAQDAVLWVKEFPLERFTEGEEEDVQPAVGSTKANRSDLRDKLATKHAKVNKWVYGDY